MMNVAVLVVDRGRHEPAEMFIKQAVRLYEKYHGEFSASGSSSRNGRVLANLDRRVGDVFFRYSQLLASMERDSEVSLMRQRLVELVRGSPSMRAHETRTLDKFDDWMALHDMREERRRGREQGHDV